MSNTPVLVKDKLFIKKIPSEAIQKRVDEIAATLNSDYQNKRPVFIGVLTGAAIFATDLFKKINIDCELTFIRVKSYQGTSSSGSVQSVIGLKENIENRDVIIIEDIIDTGHTAMYLMKELKKQNPSSIKMATVLFKPKSIQYDFLPDYIGFEIEPEFVVGYGLDYDGYGRNLNDIYVLKT